MPCSIVTLPGGQRAFVCTGRRKPARCCACGSPAKLLCDWKVDGGTCDKPICAACSISPAPGKDLCPGHAEAWAAWKAQRSLSNAPPTA